MTSIYYAYANNTLRLKIHVTELFEKVQLYNSYGISSTYRNQSEQHRLAKNTRKKDQIYRKAAERRKKHPNVPFNPENPYDNILHTQGQVTQANAYNFFITPPASAEHMLAQDQDGSESDTITVDTRSVYTEHMPPPSNQDQDNQQRKRQAHEISIIQAVENRVSVLRERVQRAKEAKRQKRLLDEEQMLIRELEELED